MVLDPNANRSAGPPTARRQRIQRRPDYVELGLDVYVPFDLRRTGDLAKAISRGNKAAQKNAGQLHLLREIHYELGRLRARFERERLDPDDADDYLSLLDDYNDEIFSEDLLNDHEYRDCQDLPCPESHVELIASARLVTRFLLAGRAGFSLGEFLESKARGAYVRDHVEYAAALGDFIPAEIREEAAEEAFTGDLNRTTDGDWPYFVSVLRDGELSTLAGLTTGLHSLDQATGGLRGLTILAGDTGVGKSTLALNLALGTLQDASAGVLFYTFELPKLTIYTRILCSFSQQTLTAIKERLTCEKGVGLSDPRLARLRIIQASPRAPLSLTRIKNDLRALRRNAKVDKILVIIDPLQRVENPVPSHSVERQEPADALSDLQLDDTRMRLLVGIHEMTRCPDLPDGQPILAVSEVRKTDNPCKRLTLADIRGHARQRYDAHCVLLLEPKEGGSDDVVPVYVNVAKVRDGGTRGDLDFDFHHRISTFTERRSPGEQPVKQSGCERPAKEQRFKGK